MKNLHHSTSNIQKPPCQQIPFEQGLRWGGGEFLYLEKYDGVFCPVQVGGALLVAEKVQNPKSKVQSYFAWTILELDGQNLRGETAGTRWGILKDVFQTLNLEHKTLNLRRAAHGVGGEFLQAVVENGGEGVVAQPWDAPWGATLFKCKRCQVFYCVVIGKDNWRGSVELGLMGETFNLQHSTFNLQLSAAPRCGKMPLRGGKFEQVKVGSILKVEAYGLTKNGQLREARPDHDTPTSWLVRW